MRKAVTQPSEAIGWSACLSLDMADHKEGQFLLDKMRERAAMKEDQTFYLPPKVRDGVLMSGVLATDAIVVKRNKKVDINQQENEKQLEGTGEVPVQATVLEAPPVVVEEKEVEEVRKDDGVLGKEKSLDLEEAGGEALDGRAEEKGEQELAVTGIRENISRESLARDTKDDQSLQAVYNLGLHDWEGYHLVEGLLFRTRMDMFGSPVEQLCMPASY